MRILITGCAGPAGQALGRQLASTGHTVVGVDMHPPRESLFHATAAVPAAADPAMLPALRRLLQEHAIDLLIPTVSDELPYVAAAFPDLLPQGRVVIGAANAVLVAHDKYLTMVALASKSVPVPRFSLPSAFPTTRDALAHFQGPIVVKPRVGRGGRGVFVVDHESDVDWAGLGDSHVVQEFAPGIEFAPMVHRSGSKGTSAVVVVQKLGLKEGRIGNATHVLRIPTLEAPDVGKVAIQGAEALGLTGPVDLDIRRRSDGSPVILEINARFGANSESAPELLQAVLDDHSPIAPFEVQ